MIMKKRFLAVSMASIIAVLAVACSSKDNNQPAQADLQTTAANEASSADNAATDNESAGIATAWSKDGNYIDDQSNHLVMYKTSMELGYAKDGFGAMLLIGDTTYSGDLDEKDGKLSGKLSVYTDDGSTGEELDVTLTDVGDYILLTKDDGTEMQFKPDDTDYSDPNFLPMFSYNQVLADIGFDPLQAAAYDYLSFDYMKDYDVSNAVIPYVQIVDIDETNGDDVLLYGDYYVWEFAREDDTLVVASGGHCPGIIHLERFGDAGEGASYSPKGTMDEAFTDEDAKTVFGDYYDHYLTLSSDDQLVESGMSQVIADYVAANELDITKYNMGAEAKELPTTRVKHITGILPAYEYPGPELFYSVLYQYMIDNLVSVYSDREVNIPCPLILAIDESDKDDIKVYGDFWMFNYYLDGDIMKTSSGGSYPGCIHVKSTADGYEVTGMDMVGDGSQYMPTAKKIFGEKYDEFHKIARDEDGREKIRAQIVANYVAANGLTVTAYQDYGWDPVPLPEENIDSFYSDLDG